MSALVYFEVLVLRQPRLVKFPWSRRFYSEAQADQWVQAIEKQGGYAMVMERGK